MHRNKSVSTHSFAQVPRADIPRSRFRMQHTYKTSFDSGYLIPVLCEEVLPGDTFSLSMTAFARLATPIFPVMDNLHLDCFFFFGPMRLLWANWQRFCGEQDNPGDSTDFVIPFGSSGEGGYAVGTLQDYFGLPTDATAIGENTAQHSALPLRFYNRVWNEWFRDENLQDSVPMGRQAGVLTPLGDGPDNVVADYVLLRRGKRKDYFTGALPWPQKGDVPVTVPIGTTAPVSLTPDLSNPGVSDVPLFDYVSGGESNQPITAAGSTGDAFIGVGTGGTTQIAWGSQTGLVAEADLSAATGATINQLRQAFQIQRLLERDARGGTRYTELVRAHFGVISPDARLQRTEYLGGGSVAIAINPVAQTSETDASTPQGNLAAFGTSLLRSGFTQSFTEHGYVLGLVSVRADLTYQQGLRRMWQRSTKYDFYWPAFAHLGEQAVMESEIFYTNGAGLDFGTVFGYQERWAEYRYGYSQITSLMRSTAAQTIDPWHLAQEFATAPTLNATFIQETPPLQRILAAGAEAAGQELILDCFFDNRAVRALPMYSVPGQIDHF